MVRTVEIIVEIVVAILFALTMIAPRHLRRARLPFVTAAILLSLWVVLRAVLLGHPPFTTVYETLLLFTALYTLKVLAGGFPDAARRFFVAPAVAGLAAALILSAIPGQFTTTGVAFASPWLFIHVPLLFLGYVSLTFAFIMQWLQIRNGQVKQQAVSREVLVASATIAVGIVSGALWAKTAWGRYWSWDPKETFALATVLVLAASWFFKHEKIRFLLLCVAMVLMLSTYFVASFLIAGHHSYRSIH